MSMFKDPAVGGNGLYVRHLADRVVIAQVTGYDPNAQYKEESKPSVTFNAMIVSGGELTFGGDLTEGIPDDKKVAVPYFATSIVSGNVNIVRALAPLAGTGELTIGLITRSTIGGKPWNFEALNPRDQRHVHIRHQAEQLWTSYASGSFVNPTPIEIATGLPVGQATPQASSASPWDSTGQAQVASQWPPQQADGLSAPASTGPGVNVPMPSGGGMLQAGGPVGPVRPPNIAEALWAAMDDATKAAVAAAAMPATKPAPPGIDPTKWAAMTPEQQREIAAVLGGTF